MNDEKIEHLRKLSLNRQLQHQLLLKQRKDQQKSNVKELGKEHSTGNETEDKINTINRKASPNSTIVDTIKNHSGIPFIISLLKKQQDNTSSLNALVVASGEVATSASTENPSDISSKPLQYEIVEENIVNLLEVSSFVLNYLIPLRAKHGSLWYKILKIIDKVIVLLRFKILASKVFRLISLQRLYNKQKKHHQENKITIVDDIVIDKDLNVVSVDNNNGNDNNNNNNNNEQHKLEQKSAVKQPELQLFESAWQESTKEESNSGDLSTLTEFSSTEDQISGLRTEVFVEFVDFLLLLYPKSITELVYDKIFRRG